MLINNYRTITDLRTKTAEVLDEAEATDQPIVIMNYSKPKSVVLSYNSYQKLTAPKPARANDPLAKFRGKYIAGDKDLYKKHDEIYD